MSSGRKPTRTRGPPMPGEAEVTAKFQAYLSNLGNVPDAKKRAYLKLPLSQQWALIVKAGQSEQQTSKVMTPEDAVEALQHRNRATIAFLRRLRVVLADASDPSYQQWIKQFLHLDGHVYLSAVWKDEISNVQQTSAKNSERLAECCRCAHSLLNHPEGFQTMLQNTNVLQYLGFSLAFINIRTQALVLTAFAAVCLVSQAGHKWVCRYFGDKFKANKLKLFLKSNEGDLCFSTFLLVNTMINQVEVTARRTAVRSYLKSQLSLSKQIKRLRNRNYLNSAELEVQVNVYQEGAQADLRGGQAFNPRATLSSDLILARNVPQQPSSIGTVLALSADQVPVRTTPSTVSTQAPVAKQTVPPAAKQLTGTKATLALRDEEIELLRNEIGKLKTTIRSVTEENETLKAAIVKNRRENGGFLGRTRSDLSAKHHDAAAAGNDPAAPVPTVGESVGAAESAAVAPTIQVSDGATTVNVPPMAVGGASPAPSPPPGAAGLPPPPINLLASPLGGPGGPGGPPPPPGGDGRSLPPPPPPALMVPKKKKQQPSKKMRPLLWTKIPPIGIKKTLWHDLDDEPIFPLLDLPQFEDLFAVGAGAASGDGSEKKAVAIERKQYVNLLPAKRANAIQIALKGSKVAPDEVQRAISSLDIASWTPDQLDSVVHTIPTAEEVQILQAYEGDPAELAPAERYLLQLIAIPNLAAIFNALVYRARFTATFEELEFEVNTLLRATEQIQTSKLLPKLLEVILALGNYTNGPSMRGGAYGFKLSSFTRFGDAKSSKDPRISFWNYLAQVVNEKFTTLLAFTREIKASHEAAKINFSDSRASITKLKADTDAVKKMLDAGEVSDAVLETFGPFHAGASARLSGLLTSVEELKGKYSKLLVMFGEPSVTPHYVFFEMFSNFIVSFEDSIEENYLRDHEPAPKPKAALKITRANGSGSGAPGMSLTQGVLSSALANLRSGAAGSGFNRQMSHVGKRKSSSASTWMAEVNLKKTPGGVKAADELKRQQQEDDDILAYFGIESASPSANEGTFSFAELGVKADDEAVLNLRPSEGNLDALLDEVDDLTDLQDISRPGAPPAAVTDFPEEVDEWGDPVVPGGDEWAQSGEEDFGDILPPEMTQSAPVPAPAASAPSSATERGSSPSAAASSATVAATTGRIECDVCGEPLKVTDVECPLCGSETPYTNATTPLPAASPALSATPSTLFDTAEGFGEMTFGFSDVTGSTPAPAANPAAAFAGPTRSRAAPRQLAAARSPSPTPTPSTAPAQASTLFESDFDDILPPIPVTPTAGPIAASGGSDVAATDFDMAELDLMGDDFDFGLGTMADRGSVRLDRGLDDLDDAF